jgi:hypothetical protein
MANSPPGSAEKEHGLVTAPASSLEEIHGVGTTTNQNESLLAPMGSMNEESSTKERNSNLHHHMTGQVSMDASRMATPDSTHESHLSELAVNPWPW